MGWKPWVALLVSAALAVGSGAVLIPRVTRWPIFQPPDIIVREMPQHNYRAPGWMNFVPVLVAIAIVIGAAWLYFWLTEPPSRIPYRPLKPADRR